MKEWMNTDLAFLSYVVYSDYRKFPSKVMFSLVSVQGVSWVSQNEFTLK